MTSSRVFRIVRAMGLRAATIATLLVVLLRGAPALADAVTDLINQLASDGSDKVRLSAALNLAKRGDPRAILPLVKAVGNDDNDTVRGAAAVGLGELISDKTKSSIKNLAVASLKKAAASDTSNLVRDQAAQALKAIGVTAPPPTSPPSPTPSATSGGGGGAIYVNIGPMASTSGDAPVDAKLKALMVKVATKTMGKVASDMAITWSGGGAPTKAQLAAASTRGFYVDGTTKEVKVQQAGSSATISCKISMLLATYPDKSIIGLLKGGASVQSSPNDVALAREDCVSAVVEDLITKQIVPTIKATP